ncbi:hypothetical protein ABTL43_19410, partial [Acinetobacter baumannii]
FDAVGAVERLDSDFTRIAARLVDGGDNDQDWPVRAPRPWPVEQMSPAVADAVVDLYGADFITFGYDPDPAAAQAAPRLPLERRPDQDLY